MKRSLLAILFFSATSSALAEEPLFQAPTLAPISEVSFNAQPDLAESEEAYEESPVVYPEVQEPGSAESVPSNRVYPARHSGYHYRQNAASCRSQANLYNNGYAGYGYRYGGQAYYYMPSMPYYHPEYGYDSYRPLHHTPRRRKSRCNYGY